MFLYIKSANAQIVILYNAFGLFDLHYSSSFIFFFFAGFVSAFLSFPFNIYYLYVHIQLYRLNIFLQYFHNYFTICAVHWPLSFFFFFFFFSTVHRFCLCSFCIFFYIFICTYTITMTQYILTIFSQLLRCQFFKSQNKIIK